MTELESINRNLSNVKVGERRKHLIFHLGGRRYALPLSSIKEVIGLTEITPLPQVPAYYKGLINLRGQIISVIDLRAKLKAPETKSKETSIIISTTKGAEFGSIVDEVVEVINYASSAESMDDLRFGQAAKVV